MKIRTGFVSNSSSSSFICCLSGEECSGMDMSIRDAGMVQCANGHTFLEEYKIGYGEELPDSVKYRKWLKDLMAYDPVEEYEYLLDIVDDEEFEEEFENNDSVMKHYDEDEDEDSYYEMNPEYCPICQLQIIPFEEIAKWYLKLNHMTRVDFAGRIRAEYNDYKSFEEDTKGEF